MAVSWPGFSERLRDNQERYDGCIGIWRASVAAADALPWWRVIAREALMREADRWLAAAHDVYLEYCELMEEVRGAR